jgi:hypothetical protein
MLHFESEAVFSSQRRDLAREPSVNYAGRTVQDTLGRIKGLTVESIWMTCPDSSGEIEASA